MSADTNGNEHQRRDKRIASIANPASQQTVGRKPFPTRSSLPVGPVVFDARTLPGRRTA